MHPSRAIRSAKRNIFSDLTNIPELSDSFSSSINDSFSSSFDASFLSSANTSFSSSVNASISSSAKATSTPNVSLQHSTKNQRKQIRKNKNRRASPIVEYTSQHTLQSLQQLCQHIMSIEFSLTYGLAVIMKYTRIVDLCKCKLNFIYYLLF